MTANAADLPYPKDWISRLLGDADVAEIVSGGTPSTQIPEYWGGAFHWATPTDITATQSKYISLTERRITQQGLVASGARMLPSGSLLLCSRATVGEIRIAAVPICTNQGFKSLVAKPGVSNEFLYYKLLTMKDEIIQRSYGSTFLELPTREARSLQVVLPGFEEQLVIAEFLSNVDSLIERLDELIAKKRAIKQGAMQQLLSGKTRFREFADPWHQLFLGDLLVRVAGGGTPSRSVPAFWNGPFPWVTVKDFASFDALSAQEYVTKAGIAASATNLIPRGTLILCTRMAVGKAVIYDVDVCINQDLKALFFKNDVSPQFMYFWFQHQLPTISAIAGGSTVAGISLGDLRAFLVSVPSFLEQQAIAQVLTDMDAEIVTLVARREKTILIKTGMMQELLTGRTRLV